MAETIENARHKSYRFFPVKKKVTLLFETDNRLSMIEGYVENNDPNIFSANEGTQISILCPDPYFKSISDYETTFSGTESLFEFPFSSEVDTYLEFSSINESTMKDIYNYGDEDVGFVGTVVFWGAGGNFALHNIGTNEFLALNDSVIASITGDDPGFAYGDVLMISTVRGDKYIRLYRGSRALNILNALTADSSWLQLYKGKNTFAFELSTGVSNLEFTIQNKTLWDGV